MTQVSRDVSSPLMGEAQRTIPVNLSSYDNFVTMIFMYDNIVTNISFHELIPL